MKILTTVLLGVIIGTTMMAASLVGYVTFYPKDYSCTVLKDVRTINKLNEKGISALNLLESRFNCK